MLSGDASRSSIQISGRAAAAFEARDEHEDGKGGNEEDGVREITAGQLARRDDESSAFAPCICHSCWSVAQERRNDQVTEDPKKDVMKIIVCK